MGGGKLKGGTEGRYCSQGLDQKLAFWASRFLSYRSKRDQNNGETRGKPGGTGLNHIHLHQKFFHVFYIEIRNFWPNFNSSDPFLADLQHFKKVLTSAKSVVGQEVVDRFEVLSWKLNKVDIYLDHVIHFSGLLLSKEYHFHRVTPNFRD